MNGISLEDYMEESSERAVAEAHGTLEQLSRASLDVQPEAPVPIHPAAFVPDSVWQVASSATQDRAALQDADWRGLPHYYKPALERIFSSYRQTVAELEAKATALSVLDGAEASRSLRQAKEALNQHIAKFAVQRLLFNVETQKEIRVKKSKKDIW